MFDIFLFSLGEVWKMYVFIYLFSLLIVIYLFVIGVIVVIKKEMVCFYGICSLLGEKGFN